MLYCKTASHWHIKDENRLDDIFISDAISHCKLTCCHCSWLERQSPLPESCRWATTAQSSTGRLLYPLRRDIDFNILYIITPSLLTLLFIAAEIKLDSLDKHTEIFIYISKYLSPEISALYRRQQRLYLSALVRGVHLPLSAVRRVRELLCVCNPGRCSSDCGEHTAVTCL